MNESVSKEYISMTYKEVYELEIGDEVRILVEANPKSDELVYYISYDDARKNSGAAEPNKRTELHYENWTISAFKLETALSPKIGQVDTIVGIHLESGHNYMYLELIDFERVYGGKL